MSSPAPPAPPPFPPHFHPSDTPFYSQNQEPWPTQQHFPPSSHFTPDFPQFPQPESHLIESPFKKSRSSEDLTLSNPDPRTPNSNPQRFHNPPQFEYGPEKIRGIGRMFFKTKLCSKFKLGTCPYTTNCNFAHGNEEIRKPPPNWQEIIAAHDEDRSVRLERREDSHGSFPGPSDYQRINRLRICKRFYSGEGCPYGDRCAFHHEEPERARESVTIRTTDGNRGGPDSMEISDGSNGGGSNGLYQRPVYWKTRICNKWETTGDCPFGDNCHFAHGQAELQKYIRGFTELNSNSGFASFKHLSSPTDDTSPNQRSSKQGQGHRSFPKLKGSTKINRIYADWIDDKELYLSVQQQLVEQN